jgi:galactitol-specific phosphotransferase system IIC component
MGLIKSFLVGLGPLVVGIVLIAVIAKLPKMGALAALVGGGLLAWGLIGAGGVAALVGERLWPSAEPWRQVKHGGLTLVCCALLPVVGWFVLLPLMAVIGGGIQVRAWFLKEPEVGSI